MKPEDVQAVVNRMRDQIMKMYSEVKSEENKEQLAIALDYAQAASRMVNMAILHANKATMWWEVR